MCGGGCIAGGMHGREHAWQGECISSGSSGRVRGGAEKHEIYVAAFVSHLFYDLFSQGRGGGHGPLGPPWIRYCAWQGECEAGGVYGGGRGRVMHVW